MTSALSPMRTEWLPEQILPSGPSLPRAAYRYLVKVNGETVFQSVNYKRAVRQCESFTDCGETAKIVTVPVYR